MDEMAAFAQIAQCLNNHEISKWKKAGGLVMGTVCSNIPEEILFATAVLPIRLRAPGLQDTSNADSRLHRINCSYTRSVLELALRGDLDFLDGLVTTNTCDHMLRLSGELQEKAGMPFVHYFSMCHSLGNAAEEWFIQEMQRLLRALEQFLDRKIPDENLRKSISIYNKTRSLMRRVYELRKKEAPPLSGADYLRLALAGMSAPREWFNQKLEALLPRLEAATAPAPTRPRLMIIGGACDVPDFIHFIEQRGAVVVADSLCFGTRHYEGMIDESEDDPLRAIARRYLSRAACPSIFNGFEHNMDMYRNTIREWRIDAIICARLKFCDHWAGARKMLADELRRENLPLLDLEREYGTSGSGQISTRVQAFLEMLKS